MFVGKYVQLARDGNLTDLYCAGAAIGSLGRHTHVTPDGMPIFDERMEVFFKVGLNVTKFTVVVNLTTLT